MKSGAAMKRPTEETANDIVDVVIDLLEGEGIDGVNLRTVARRAHVSLTTIYKLFGSRDELIVAATMRWMDDHAYAPVEPADPGETAYESISRVIHTIFAPWESKPQMLNVFHRASKLPGGERLRERGAAVAVRGVDAAMADVDPALREDTELIMHMVLQGALTEFSTGAITVEEIVPILDRALFRLIGTDQRAAAHSGSATRES